MNLVDRLTTVIVILYNCNASDFSLCLTKTAAIEKISKQLENFLIVDLKPINLKIILHPIFVTCVGFITKSEIISTKCVTTQHCSIVSTELVELNIDKQNESEVPNRTWKKRNEKEGIERTLNVHMF